MEEFWEKFTTNRYWFMGTLFVFLMIFLFLWHAFDPEGYNLKVILWIQSIKDIFYSILTLAIIGIGIGIIIKSIYKKKGH